MLGRDGFKFNLQFFLRFTMKASLFEMPSGLLAAPQHKNCYFSAFGLHKSCKCQEKSVIL